MGELVKELQYKGFAIKVETCDWSDSPREWDNMGKMVCEHGRYELGDEQYTNSYANNWREWFAYYVMENLATMDLPSYDTYGYFDDKGVEVDKVWKWIDKNLIVYKLSLYDHSGITISNVNVDTDVRGWDSGCVGFHYVTRESVLKEYGKKKLTKDLITKAYGVLDAELATYDDYIRGNVYEFNVEDKSGTIIDSCGGFYRYDEEKSGLMASAKESIDNYISIKAANHYTKLKAWIKSNVPYVYRHKLELNY